MLYSSVAAHLGGPGQANYAAANAFLDALAQHRRSPRTGRPVPGLGPVGQRSGMSVHLDATEARAAPVRRRRHAFREQGMALFDRPPVTVGDAALVPTRLDLAAVRAQAAPGPYRPCSAA